MQTYLKKRFTQQYAEHYNDCDDENSAQVLEDIVKNIAFQK
jgi:hypothetical protein